LARGMRRGRSVWVINFEIKDTPMDAAVGAQAILQTVRAIEKAGSEEGIARVLDELQMKQSNISVLYTVHFL
jgi:hypothetical protein